MAQLPLQFVASDLYSASTDLSRKSEFSAMSLENGLLCRSVRTLGSDFVPASGDIFSPFARDLHDLRGTAQPSSELE